MYKTILVPLDGSMRAEEILPHVEELALRFRAKLILAQVVEPAPLTMVQEIPYMRLHQQEFDRRNGQAESYLHGVQVVFREKGIDAHVRVVYGPVVKAIVGLAEQEEADLIAIASHGRGGLSQVFYGSVAAGLLQRVDRPLLVVRARG
jgi:nucleotide-binding universal stress UspA family protein